MRIKITALAGAVQLVASSACAEPIVLSKGKCGGTYRSDACVLKEAPSETSVGTCRDGFPRKRGARDEFVGFERHAGSVWYVVYRVGIVPAGVVHLDRNCVVR